MKVAIDGGAPTTLVTEKRGPSALAVGTTNVHWSTMPTTSDSFDGKLMATPKD